MAANWFNALTATAGTTPNGMPRSSDAAAEAAPGGGLLGFLLTVLLMWTVAGLFHVRTMRRLETLRAAQAAHDTEQATPAWIPQQVHVGGQVSHIAVVDGNAVVVMDRPRAPVGIVLERVPTHALIAGRGGTIASLVSFGANGARFAVERGGVLVSCAGEAVRWATDQELAVEPTH